MKKSEKKNTNNLYWNNIKIIFISFLSISILCIFGIIIFNMYKKINIKASNESNENTVPTPIESAVYKFLDELVSINSIDKNEIKDTPLRKINGEHFRLDEYIYTRVKTD